MTSSLKAAWNRHALPDDAPGEAADEFGLSVEEGGESKTARRIREYSEAQLGYSNRANHISSDSRNTPDGRAAAQARAASDSMTLLAVGSPAYMEAYNTKLTFNLDGEDCEFSQGQLYELSKKRAEEQQRQIDAARKRGTSDQELARMQADLDAYVTIRDNANPQLGKATPERQAAIGDAMTSTPTVKDYFKGEARTLRDPENAKTQKSETTFGVDNDGGVQDWALHERMTAKASVASQVSDNPFADSAPALSPIFAAVAPNTPPAPAPAEEPAPEAPAQNMGFSLG